MPFNNLNADGMNKFLNWFSLQLGILNLLPNGNISNSGFRMCSVAV